MFIYIFSIYILSNIFFHSAMADKFKFKYLDPDYIKRLQVNVTKKTSQSLKDTSKDEGIEQSRSDDKRNLTRDIVQNEDNTECDITKFRTKMMSTKSKKAIPQRPTVIVPTLKLNPARSSAPVNYVSRNASRKVSSIDTSSSRIQSQRTFDDIETTLAKITSSQQTICSVMDSLMPNLMQKPSFETPKEAENCRKRFDDFLKVFTRNYLYPIELMLTEIQSDKYFSPAGFASKVLSLHNILQVAVSSYVSNVRSFLDHDVPPKIENLVGFIQLTTIVCVEKMLFDEEDCVVQSVLDKVDEVLIQLETIRSAKKLRQKLKPKCATVKGSEKQPNRLCMYGFPKLNSKPVQKSVDPVQPRYKGEKIMQAVSRSGSGGGGGSGAFNRGDQQSQRQSASRSNDIMFQKHMTRRPAFGSKDKIIDAKCDFNDSTKFGVNQPTVSQHRLLNNHTVVDSTNRTASGLMVEKELFKSKNTKYSQIISTKDVDEHVNVNQKSANDTSQDNDELTLRMKKSQIRDKLSKSQAKEKKVNLFPPQKSLGSKKLLLRITEELNAAPVERFHKNLDFGERMFIEKFIALETSI